MQILRYLSTDLLGVNFLTGARYQIGGATPIRTGPGSAMLEFVEHDSDSDAILILEGPTGRSMVLRPGDTFPTDGHDWTLLAGAIGGDDATPRRIVVALWSAAEALYRREVNGVAPRRAQRYYTPDDVGLRLKQLPFGADVPGLPIDCAGMREVTAYATMLNAGPATSWSLKLYTGVVPLSLYPQGVETVAGAVGTLAAPYVQTMPVAQGLEVVHRWQINDLYMRLDASTPDGTTADRITVAILLGA